LRRAHTGSDAKTRGHAAKYAMMYPVPGEPVLQGR
jgi:hypothetical protein